MIKRFYVAILFFSWVVYPVSGLCDPSPFGLEIGKPVSGELKNKYLAKDAGKNRYSGGEMYGLDPSRIAFEGLISLRLISGKDGRLIGVLAKVNKSRFESVLESLREKYKAVSSSIPFVGDKVAVFTDGDTEITLDAPHLSFAMDLNYIHKDLMKVFTERSAEEERQKKKRQSSNL